MIKSNIHSWLKTVSKPGNKGEDFLKMKKEYLQKPVVNTDGNALNVFLLKSGTRWWHL